ncbi:hypothetical protein ACFPPD_06810 [Cohnella suwonensis]|uniref:Uncharacterized protein n=1 Tax=Cohnella suwonensis TaxID=696072 RepID=A0ABW0LR96_9BACL
MNVVKIIQSHFEFIGKRSYKAGRDHLEELGEKGVSKSTFAVSGSFETLSKQLNLEIVELFKKMSHLKFRLKHLKAIQEKLLDFTTGQFEEWKAYLIQIKIFHIGGDQWQFEHEKFIESKLRETRNIIELEILTIQQRTIQRYRSIMWDVGKILFSAIIGGLIGAYIKGKAP